MNTIDIRYIRIYYNEYINSTQAEKASISVNINYDATTDIYHTYHYLDKLNQLNASGKTLEEAIKNCSNNYIAYIICDKLQVLPYNDRRGEHIDVFFKVYHSNLTLMDVFFSTLKEYDMHPEILSKIVKTFNAYNIELNNPYLKKLTMELACG